MRGFAALSPQTVTLADISWRHVMAQTWELAFKECGIPSGVLSPAGAIKSWTMILEILDLNTMGGLHIYVDRWARDDGHVADLMSASETKINDTADSPFHLLTHFGASRQRD